MLFYIHYTWKHTDQPRYNLSSGRGGGGGSINIIFIVFPADGNDKTKKILTKFIYDNINYILMFELLWYMNKWHAIQIMVCLEVICKINTRQTGHCLIYINIPNSGIVFSHNRVPWRQIWLNLSEYFEHSQWLNLLPLYNIVITPTHIYYRDNMSLYCDIQ